MKKVLLILTILQFTSGWAQWQIGGNPPAGPFGVFQPNNNFLGSQPGNGSAIKFGVNGSQDIFIDNNPAQLLPGNGFGYVQGGHWVGLGRIFQPTIGPGSGILTPRAHLHIHGGNSTIFFGFAGGLRPWFQTGTLYTENSDGMYVGLRTLGANQSYAVINWTDDGFGTTGTDFLSFNFTGGPGPLSTTNDGMELGRFNPTYVPGGAPGTFGVGNFQAIGTFTEPVRRVEILDADPATGTNANAPQLRLTYSYNANPAQGIFSEIQVMSTGHTYFNTRANTTPRFFGFHTNIPGNTVEINSVIGSPYFGTGFGCSGLRFKNLISLHQVVPNGTNGVDATKVLTVDNDGDVVLTNPIAASSTNNGITTLPPGLGGPIIQLGVDCQQIFSQPALLAQATLQTDRLVLLNSKNLVFFEGNSNTADGRVGIGNIGFANICNPRNTLEVGADAGSLYNPTGANGSSGLRFTHLNSGHTPIANGVNGVNSSRVLTVDGNGDVVLTDATGGLTGCNTLTAHTGFNLNGFNFYFNDQGTPNNSVGIGVPCATPLPAKLSVRQVAGVSNSIGITTNNTDLDGVALKAISTGGSSAAQTKVAGWFESAGPGSIQGYGQVAIFVPQQKGVVNIGFPTPNAVAQGTWAGLVNINGTLSTLNGNVQASDASLKHNIQTIDNGLSKIIRLRPVTFEWDTIRDTLMAGIRSGFIAQEVSNVIPEMVHNIGGSQALAYSEFIPYVVSGIQQQQLSIDSLRNAPPGSVAASNGLSVNSGTVQLGGSLNQATQIAMGANNFELLNNTNGNISLGSNPAVYPTSGGGANGANIAIGHNNNFTNQHGMSLGDNNSVGYFSTAIGNTNDLANANNSAALGTSIKLENTGGGNITTATGIGEGLHNYASHAIVMGQQVAVPPGGSGVFIGSHFATSAVTAMESYISSNPGATYQQIDADAQTSQQGLQPDYIPGVTVSNANRVGVGILAPNAKLDVYGSINSNGFPVTSDSTLKTNIQVVNNGAITKIKALRPVTYEWINKVDTFMYGTQYGFTAQQVETVAPELVKTTSNNVKHLNYNGVISLLTKAVQEQQTLIDSLMTMMQACCSNNAKNNSPGNSVSAIDVELSDPEAIVLNQNVPNPFAEQTTITYNIPKNTSAAQILFYDINGRQIKAVDITKKGKGQLNVFANDLSNGIYSYTLIVDGKIFETKKMVKQQ